MASMCRKFTINRNCGFLAHIDNIIGLLADRGGARAGVPCRRSCTPGLAQRSAIGRLQVANWTG